MYIYTATADNDLIYHVLPDELARMHGTLAAISGKSMVEGKEEDPRGLVTETTRLFEWLVPAALHHTAEKVHTHTNTNPRVEWRGLKMEVETYYLKRVYSVSSDFSRSEWESPR